MRFRGGFTLSEALGTCGTLVTHPPTKPENLPQHFLSLDDPGRGDSHSLIVVGSDVRLEIRENLNAALIFAEEGVDSLPGSLPVVTVKNARRVLLSLLRFLSSRIENPSSGLIGEGTQLETGAVVRENCVIGKHCLIQSGAVIGCDGFGFVETENGLELMPHLAGVRIGDHCFIGANTLIAAGVLHPTEIGDGCKLDSHVQIAHNVRLGRNGLLASQSGIAGSTTVGVGLRMGGAASIAGHLRLGNNVSVAAKSGVTKDLPDGAIVAGFPARPIDEWRKEQIFLKNLGVQE